MSICVGAFKSLHWRRVETVPERLLSEIGCVCARRHGCMLLLFWFLTLVLIVIVTSIPSGFRYHRCCILFVRKVRLSFSGPVGILAHLYALLATNVTCTLMRKITHVAHLVTNTLHDGVVRGINDLAKVPTNRLETDVKLFHTRRLTERLRHGGTLRHFLQN